MSLDYMSLDYMSLDKQPNLRNSRRRRRQRITLSVLAVIVAAVLAVIVAAVLAVIVAAVLVVVGFVVVNLVNANNKIMRPDAPASVHQVPTLTKDTNILPIGPDSRVDEQGPPLSPEL